MSISTFGGKPPTVSSGGTTTSASTMIGELVNVPNNFKNDNYVSSGDIFDPLVYPDLVNNIKPGFNSDYWKKVIIPIIPKSASSQIIGSFVNAVTFAGEFYAFFSLGYVYKTTNGDLATLSYFTKLAKTGFGINQVTLANNNIFVSYSNSSMVVYTEPTLSKSANITMAAAGAWCVVYGDGVYFAFIKGVSIIPYRSTNGTSWVTQEVTTTGAISGIDWSGTFWLLSTIAITASNYATSSNSTTWTAVSGPTVVSNHMRWNPTLRLFVSIPNVAGVAVYTSTNGTSWIARTIVTFAPTWLDIGVNGSMNLSNNLSTGSNNMWFSNDGITWISRLSVITSALAPANLNLSTMNQPRIFGELTVVFGMVSTSNAGQYSYGVSNDGLVTMSYCNAMFINSLYDTSVYNPIFLQNKLNGILISSNVGANNSTVGPYVSLTYDGGKTWRMPYPSNITSSNSHITWQNVRSTVTRFIMNGINSANTRNIASSIDGITWLVTPATPIAGVLHIIDETLYLLPTSGATTVIYSSIDYGFTWSSTLLYNVTVSWPNMSFQVGTNAIILGTSGSYAIDMLTGFVKSVNYSSANTATFLISSPKGAIAILQNTTSPFGMSSYMFSYDNGLTWIGRAFPTIICYNNAKAIVYYAGNFILFTNTNAYWYSSDGINWLSSGISENPISWNAFSSDQSMVPTMGGSSGGYYISGDDTSTRVPYVEPLVNGSKWVVRAK